LLLLSGLTKIFSLDLLACVALGSTILLEHAWHFAHFKKEDAGIPILWYLGFTAVFTISHLFFIASSLARVLFGERSAGRAASFLSRLRRCRAMSCRTAEILGLVPAAFAVPSLLGLAALLRLTPKDSPARNAQLALFGGPPCFHHFDFSNPIRSAMGHAWLGAGRRSVVLRLFHRVPHPVCVLRDRAAADFICAAGLQSCCASLSPANGDAIFNWYLYTYGIVSICFFVAARLWRRRVIWY